MAGDNDDYAKMVNNKCLLCGGSLTGGSIEFISEKQITQDCTCDDCGEVWRHFYTLSDVVPVKED